MFDVNLKVQLILGKPISLNGIGLLKSIKIKDIMDIGFDNYNKYLSYLCMSSEDILDLLNSELENIEPFDFIFSNCFYDEKFKEDILCAFSYFFDEKCRFSENGYFYLGNIDEERFIHSRNFNFLSDVLRIQNCVEDKKDNLNLKSKAAKDFYKRLKQARRKHESEKSSNMDISDIISAISAKHPSINIFNIEELTMYQLIDQYKRINMIDEYLININSLLHGASKDDVKLTHWSSNIK